MKIFFALFLLLISGCSATAQRQCKQWQSEGDFFGSMDSCKRCVAQMGENKEAVKGCALGMDASNLIGGLR